MQKKKLLIGCIVLVLVLVVAGVLYRNLSGNIDSDNLGSQTPENENQQQNGDDNNGNNRTHSFSFLSDRQQTAVVWAGST